MPWLINSRGRRLQLRDGAGPYRPLYWVDDLGPYLFDALPPGTDPVHDGDVVCTEVDEEAARDCLRAPLVQMDRPPEPPPPKADEGEKPAPRKRKPRVR